MNPLPPPASGSADDQALAEEWARLRAENRRILKRRAATIGVVLIVAAGVQWHRQIALWAASRWYTARGGGAAIDVDAAIRLLQERNAVVIDVRSPEEYAISHLDGARSLPLSRIERGGWPPGWPRNRPVIAYCTIGYRSGRAAALLAEEGLDARNLAGGILALAEADAPLVDDDSVTWTVHTWSDAYGWLLPPTHRATWSAGGE